MNIDFYRDKTIFVTGACGTIGAALVTKLSELPCAGIIGIDRNETGLLEITERFKSYPNIRFYLSDICNYHSISSLVRGVDMIFHAAALKHVFLCEEAPSEAVNVNILGMQNIIDAAMIHGVRKVIFASSDKAVNPTNVMGTSKLMGERLITSANSRSRDAHTVFSSTRFGNVIGSSGSVVQTFARQIMKGGPVTLTDPEMTRFAMTVDEATALLLESAENAIGGEVFITKMPVIKIRTLAEVMIELISTRCGFDPTSIEITTVGRRPGEKLFEELMSSEETRRALELTKYYVVLPPFNALYRNIDYEYIDRLGNAALEEYHSGKERPLDHVETRAFLTSSGILEGL